MYNCMARPTNHEEEKWYRLTTLKGHPLERHFGLLAKCPLYKRGWALQEIVLSPRMLTFYDHEVYWQCAEVAACESFPYSESEQISRVSDNPFWMVPDARFLERTRLLGKDEQLWNLELEERRSAAIVRMRWCGLMQRYGEASLTFPDKDIFKALEGVGQDIAHLTSDIYRYGLHEKAFPPALMWSAQSARCRRSLSQRAPAWHWASYEGPVDFAGESNLYEQAKMKDLIVSLSAYAFMSDTCEKFARGHANDLWPSLFCIGKLIRPGDAFESSETSAVRPLAYFPKFDHDSGMADSNEERTLLPLADVRKIGPLNSQGPWKRSIKYMSTRGLIVQKTGRAKFRRVGYFVQYGPRLLDDIRMAKPRLIELE